MTCEVPCMSYVALYVISMHIVNSNSRASSAHSHHWKLNLSSGKVEQASAEPEKNGSNSSASGNSTATNKSQEGLSGEKNIAFDHNIVKEDSAWDEHMMNILTKKVISDGEWIVLPSPESCVHDVTGEAEHSHDCSNHNDLPRSQYKEPSVSSSESQSSQKSKVKSKKRKPLSCGKPVNSTIYDHLRGISERFSHSHIPEPDVAMVFRSSNGRSAEIDMAELERKLRDAKREIQGAGPAQREKSSQVYNLIGNFWRIKGNTQVSIECFRKALSLSPDDPDVLLNLSRVLFNLHYLDDAIFLARRSLHLQSPGENAWLQHYTLGEILKSYGHLQEAAMHFNQALELKPGFQPAKSHLRELEEEPSPSVTHLTLFIILFLVIGVLFGVVTSIESNFQELGSLEGKSQQRHFNRAMAMRSIKLGINPRLCRLRKANA